MYLPEAFREEDLATLHDLIRGNSFTSLVTVKGDQTSISHLPFLLDQNRGANGTLIAHMAKASKHWKEFEEPGDSFVIFTGPHAYISPAWYEKKESVPTWNYAVVHAYGRPALIEDGARLREIMFRLVDQYEAPLGRPWNMAVAAKVIEEQLTGIVGFEMPIDRIEGKFKFNQNRPLADQQGVIRTLEGSPDPTVRQVADIMRANLKKG